jgi:hypothetical protein
MPNSPRLNDLKKDLAHLNAKELLTLLLRMTKMKVENKELLNYILYYDEKPLEYAQSYIDELVKPILECRTNDFYLLKGLRKSKRLISKIFKITKSREAELFAVLALLEAFREHYPTPRFRNNTRYFIESLMLKLEKNLSLLNEDLRLDYQYRINELKEWKY